jgi:hypothetical protein
MSLLVGLWLAVGAAWAGPKDDAKTLAGWDGRSDLTASHFKRLRDAFRSGNYTTEQKQQVLGALVGEDVEVRVKVSDARDGLVIADLDDEFLSISEVQIQGLSERSLYKLQDDTWYTFSGAFAGGKADTLTVEFYLTAASYE